MKTRAAVPVFPRDVDRRGLSWSPGGRSARESQIEHVGRDEIPGTEGWEEVGKERVPSRAHPRRPTALRVRTMTSDEEVGRVLEGRKMAKSASYLNSGSRKARKLTTSIS